jgi:hypothetical protein
MRGAPDSRNGGSSTIGLMEPDPGSMLQMVEMNVGL